MSFAFYKLPVLHQSQSYRWNPIFWSNSFLGEILKIIRLEVWGQQPTLCLFWGKLPPIWGFGPSSGCSVLVLDLAQLLSLEFGILRSYLKQECTQEPSKRSSVWFSASPRWRHLCYHGSKLGTGSAESFPQQRGEYITRESPKQTGWGKEAAEEKSAGDTQKEELPAWEIGRIRLRCPRYVTGGSLPLFWVSCMWHLHWAEMPSSHHRMGSAFSLYLYIIAETVPGIFVFTI